MTDLERENAELNRRKMRVRDIEEELEREKAGVKEQRKRVRAAELAEMATGADAGEVVAGGVVRG